MEQTKTGISNLALQGLKLKKKIAEKNLQILQLNVVTVLISVMLDQSV